MKKLNINLFGKTLLFIFPLLLNLIFLLIINKILGNNFINYIDGGLLLTKVEVHKKFLSLWAPNNMGSVNSIFVSVNFFSYLFSFILLKLNLSIKMMELIIYFVFFNSVFYSSWFAFYLLQKRVFDGNNNIFYPFLTAFFYSYNILVISLIGTLDSFFLPLLMAPYLLYVLISLIDKKINIKHILLLTIIIALTINMPPFSVALYICLFIPFILFKKKLNIKISASFILIFILACILASSIIFALIHTYTALDPFNNPSNVEKGYIFPPFGMMGIFQLFFNWGITTFDTQSNIYFRGGIGLISTYLLWILILFILVRYWKNLKNKRILCFIILSLLLSMFLCKGNQKPLGEMNLFMYQSNPVFRIFRTPGSKFSLPIMLTLSVLILFSLNVQRKKILLLAIIGVIIMQTWIFFSPATLLVEKNTTYFNSNMVEISQDYKNLILFFNNEKKEGAVLLYPELNTGHFDLKNGNKFTGQDILGKFIERPIIYPGYSLLMTLSKRNIQKMIENFDMKTVGDSSIRYIAIRNDFDMNRLNEKAEINSALRKLQSNDYNKVFESKLFTVFEINNKYYKDLITIRTGWNEFTPFYKQIAPYEYVIKIKPSDLINNQVIFRNNFHPDWKILDLEKKGLKANQILVDNFANGWEIKPLNEKTQLNLDQQIELDIYFYPQKIFSFLMKVSIISFIIIGSSTTYLLIKKDRKHNIDNSEPNLKTDI